jgi:hypothetical protein
MDSLIRYDNMCDAIDAAYEIDEVKEIHDKAVALEHYARQAHNMEAERRACEIRLRAERKAGQLTAKIKKIVPRRGHPISPGDNGSKAAKLKQTGITPKQAQQWEKLGAASQADFDLALVQADKPTTIGIIKATSAPKINPVAGDALWLWERLRDFERNGILDKEHADVMRTMTSEMKDDVHTLAPFVAAWLKRIAAQTDGDGMPTAEEAEESYQERACSWSQ